MNIGIIAPFNVLSSSEGVSIGVFELYKGLNNNGASVFILHHGDTKSYSPDFKLINFKSYDLLLGSGIYLHPVNSAYTTILQMASNSKIFRARKDFFLLKNMTLHTCFDVDQRHCNN